MVALWFCLIANHWEKLATAQETDRLSNLPSMKLLVPAYFYPSGEGLATWNRLIESKSTAPQIEIIAIANINSGNVGTTVDQNYADVIRRAVKGGLKVVAYITSDYANLHGVAPLETAKTNVTNWFKLYPELHGIFIDEQTSDPAPIETYYRPLRQHIDAVKPKALVIGNPGNNCDEGYLAKRSTGAIMDIIIIHENNETRLPYSTVKPADWMASYSPNQFAVLDHTSEKFVPQIEWAQKNGISYVFVTDATGPPPDSIHPWGKLPSYWNEELKFILELNRRTSN
jgi:hypothetical protein